jgi:hypothetical protein
MKQVTFTVVNERVSFRSRDSVFDRSYQYLTLDESGDYTGSCLPLEQNVSSCKRKFSADALA